MGRPRATKCAICGLSKEDAEKFRQIGTLKDGSPQLSSYCFDCEKKAPRSERTKENARLAKERRRRARGVPKKGEKPFCAQGHARTPENLTGGDCKTCAREREEKNRRAQGVQPQGPGLNWTCGHDPATSMRYSKGKPKGCMVCHREKERQRPYNAERVRAYARANRAAINARYRLWKAVNRPDVADYRRGGPEALEYAKIIDSDPCVYCGEPGVEKDHIIPVASGGGGTWDNFAPACRSCNASKNDTDVLRFMLRRLNRAA